MTRIVAVLTVGVVAGGCSPLEGLLDGKDDPNVFSSVDLDRDQGISADELADWGTEQSVFESVLGGTEEGIGNVDLADGLFGLWNTGGAGLTEEEWNDGLATWFPGEDAGDFAAWDLDGDETLDGQEVRAGFGHSGLGSAWDADGDGNLMGEEVYESLHEVFDIDGDGLLDKEEWRGAIGHLGM